MTFISNCLNHIKEPQNIWKIPTRTKKKMRGFKAFSNCLSSTVVHIFVRSFSESLIISSGRILGGGTVGLKPPEAYSLHPPAKGPHRLVLVPAVWDRPNPCVLRQMLETLACPPRQLCDSHIHVNKAPASPESWGQAFGKC